jgi:hypothetical protein
MRKGAKFFIYLANIISILIVLNLGLIRIMYALIADLILMKISILEKKIVDDNMK